MKNKIIIIVFFIALIIVIFSLTPRGWKASLISPQTTPVPTQVPPVAPKTIKYDRSTDLKMELDSVNPEVLDSDFNE